MGDTAHPQFRTINLKLFNYPLLWARNLLYCFRTL
jgi:hypothetical protein